MPRLMLAVLMSLAVASAVAARDVEESIAESAIGDIRCATYRVNAFTTDRKSAALERPAPGSFQETSARVIVHYNDAALASYAQEVRDAAELTYEVLIDTLGFSPPPSDGVDGGDSRTDIYIRPAAVLGPGWGVAARENLVGAPYDSSFTSWVELTDTLALARLRTVTAHEVFHVIQLGYDGFEQASFLEMISTWCEDRVFDAIDLYLEVLPAFFEQPEKALFSHVYSNVPWMFYLTEVYGDTILVDIMDQCGQTTGPNVRAATDAALATRGTTTFSHEFQVFGNWNYFTGARDDGFHYREGANWPLVSVEKRSNCFPFFDYFTMHAPGRLGANYFFFDGDRASDMMRLLAYPEFFGSNLFSVTRFVGGVSSTQNLTFPASTVVDSVTIDNWSDCDSVLAIFQIDTSAQTINNVGISAFFVTNPPPASPYVLVFDRDGCRRPFDGISDDFSTRDGEERPFGDAFAALGVTSVQSDSIPDNLSLCGGIFVVGGFDNGGTTIDSEDLVRLTSFMDTGGDVYLEGSRFGEWVDPGIGKGSPEEEAFWSRFGCTFTPGESQAVGNVLSWNTVTTAMLGAFVFDYAFATGSDDHVGLIVPTTADTLALDQAGNVRMSVNHGPSGSERVYATVLLGGSRGGDGMSSRMAFLSGILDVFDSIVPALSVVRANIALRNDHVVVEGTLFGYNGEALRLERWQDRNSREIDLSLAQVGSEWRFRGEDTPPSGKALYRLTVAASNRLVWQQGFSADLPARPLALVNAYPMPSRGDVTLVVDTDRAAVATVRVYDPAGRLAYEAPARLTSGTSSISLSGADGFRPRVSGIYFVRIDANGQHAVRKLLILR